MKFIHEDFLLQNPTAKHLYHTYAKELPIIDFHCHISPELIANNHSFKDLQEVWISDDHYKWTAMRWCGIDEDKITGKASSFEKFMAYSQALPMCIGNPLHHWSHLELYKFFGFDGHLTEKTAKAVWDMSNARLKRLKARDFLKQTNVELLCTTDDPIDDLKWHKKYETEKVVGLRMLPAFRPDKVLGINNTTYMQYLEKLSDVCKMPIENVKDLQNCVKNRLDYFAERGCKISDHGLEKIVFQSVSDEDVERIFAKRRSGELVSDREVESFITSMMLFLASEYTKRNWVMQLHFGVARDISPILFNSIGVDAGGDCMRGDSGIPALIKLLTKLESQSSLPKTILFSINPNDNALLGTIAGCFQNAEAKGKIQHGCAWWFNDSLVGMEEQLQRLASLSSLGSFVGMLTDSRSVLSYTRHDYFRRILCNFLGEMVEKGHYPNAEEHLKEIVENICYYNAKSYFNF